MNDHGFTVLMLAAAEGHMGLTKALIKANVDINAANHDGYTPLIAAAYHGNLG